MTDLNRPTPEQTAAFRQAVLRQKREAVYRAAAKYYTMLRLASDSEWAQEKLREAWRPVAYNVADLVIEEMKRYEYSDTADQAAGH